MLDKKQYLESLVEGDLEKFIMNNLDADPNTLIELCIEFLDKRDKK